MDRTTLKELHSLLSAMLDGALTGGQHERLAELLRQDADARDLYLAYFGLHADLAVHGSLQPVSAPQLPVKPPAPAVPQRVRRLRWGWVALALGGLAAGVLLALTLMRPPDGSRKPAPTPTTAEPTDNTVAVLIQAPGAEWEDTGLQTRAGAPLAPGWLRLKAGVAHIEFYSGATVILQGPARLKLISRMEAFCAAGKLRATVPPHAQGFTIRSPKLDLVDRGTEFGMEVGDGEQTEVHVFQGKVELYKPGADLKTARHEDVSADHGVRLHGPGDFRPVPLNRTGFVTAQDLVKQQQEATERCREKWRAASAALRADPDLLVYYTFQPENPWSRILLDRAGGRKQPRDGAIVGCAWGPGRWLDRDKQGLEFKRVSDRVRLTVPGEYDSLTLMAWVRVDALPNLNNSLFMTDGWEPGGVHWQIGNTGMLILGVQSEPKGRGAHYDAPGLITPDLFGRWTHLAVVYDRADGQVTHYVDGRLAWQAAILFDTPLRLGAAELGNWNMAAHRNKSPIRNFNGCVDEFLLFSRALAAQEIEQLAAQGRPPS
jgi:hypothetical protein